MKKILALTFLVATVASSAFAAAPVKILAGSNSFTPLYACGPAARAKAVYSKSTGVLTLRVCGNIACVYPVWINTNAQYEPKQETSIYSSKFSAGVQSNGECSDFPMNYRVQPNQRNIRAVFGGGFFSNQAKIDIELY